MVQSRHCGRGGLFGVRRTYLSSLRASGCAAGSVVLRPVVVDHGRLVSVGAGAAARLLLGCLARCAVRVLRKEGAASWMSANMVSQDPLLQSL